MAPCPCNDLNHTLHGSCWRDHEQVHVQVQTVSRFKIELSLQLIWRRLSLQYIADGGSLAEEVISTVRTAHAFGTQKILSGLYDTHVHKSLDVDLKGSVFHGIGLAFFFFVIYASYGLAFHFGTTLIIQGHGMLSIPSQGLFAHLPLQLMPQP